MAEKPKSLLERAHEISASAKPVKDYTDNLTLVQEIELAMAYRAGTVTAESVSRVAGIKRIAVGTWWANVIAKGLRRGLLTMDCAKKRPEVTK